MHTSIYKPNRQLLFIQRQATLFMNRWLIAAAAIFGLLLVVTLFTAIALNPVELADTRGLHYFLFYLVGLVFTSQIFLELHSPNQAYSFLTLPVSTLEKLVGSWLLSSPIYILVYTILSFTIYLLGNLVAGIPAASANFFSMQYWDSVASYLIIQTIFLWGACYFRKNNFLKTLLTTVVFGIVIGLFGSLLGWLLIGQQVEAAGDISIQINPDTFEGHWVGTLWEFIFTWLFAPYMLLVSYFTLKERQL